MELSIGAALQIGREFDVSENNDVIIEYNTMLYVVYVICYICWP